MDIRTRYRNKLEKIIVELFYEGKWYYIKTLPTPDKLFEKECLDKVSQLKAKKSEINEEEQEKVRLTDINTSFVKDIPKPLTKEEIDKLAWELAK